MTDQLPLCQIPGNSDIAGVGVRASVYTQACLAVLNVAYLFHLIAYYREERPSDVVELQASPVPGSPSVGNILTLRASTSPSQLLSSPSLSTPNTSDLDNGTPLPPF